MRKYLLLFLFFISIGFSLASPVLIKSDANNNSKKILNFADEGLLYSNIFDTTRINAKTYNLKIFPNPIVNDQFTVKSSKKISSIEILNVIGQTILKKENVSKDGDISIVLNKPEKGIYFVKIIFENKKTLVQKVLIK